MNKNELRTHFLNLRRNMSIDEKNTYDNSILEQLFNNTDFQIASTILIYVSTKYEVDTIKIIKKALLLGKKVGVPKCSVGTNDMTFHSIKDLSELKAGYFNILEPLRNNPITDFSNSICIVPGLSFDCSNHRLGYGKGFYDKFLSKYSHHTIGLCYKNCICNKLPTNDFDIPVIEKITD